MLRIDAEVLLLAHHLQEMFVGVGVCCARQRGATVLVRECPHPEAVGGVEMALHEVTAGFTDLVHLQKRSRKEDLLHVVHGQDDLGGVHELNDGLQRLLIDVLDLQAVVPALDHLRHEHGAEVRAAGCQYEAMAEERRSAATEREVAERLRLVELLYDDERFPPLGLAVEGEGCDKGVVHLRLGRHLDDFILYQDTFVGRTARLAGKLYNDHRIGSVS